jgi:adenosylcobinamide-GDP ribazoletransferase
MEIPEPIPPAPPSRSPVTGLRIAVAFLTRLPVGELPPATSGDLAAAAPWFPVIGLAVGGLAALVRLGAGALLPAAPSTILALAAAMLVTGGLHEDGLADMADALGAHVDRTRRLEILRDPRVGAFGALALGVALLFAFATLTPLSEAHFARAVIAAGALARFTPLLQSRLSAPARLDGAGVLLRTSDAALAIALFIAVAGALVVGEPGPGAVAVGVTLLCTLAVAWLVRRVFGGTTGDTFGAGAKLAELACYAAFAAFWT